MLTQYIIIICFLVEIRFIHIIDQCFLSCHRLCILHLNLRAPFLSDLRNLAPSISNLWSEIHSGIFMY